MLDTGRRRVEADMFCKRSEMYEISAQRKGRNLVFDRFLGVGSGIADDASDLLEDVLHVFGEAGDIRVNSCGWRFRFHICVADERHGSPSRRGDLSIVKTHRSATLVHPIVRPVFCVDVRRARRNSVQARVSIECLCIHPDRRTVRPL